MIEKEQGSSEGGAMGLFDKIASKWGTKAKQFYTRGSTLGYIDMCQTLYKGFAERFPDLDPAEILVAVHNFILVKSGAIKEKQIGRVPDIAWSNSLVPA